MDSMNDLRSIIKGTSISDLIGKNKEVKGKFKEWFVKPPFSKSKLSMIHPLITDKAPLLGTAFDYLLRFKLQYSNSKAKAIVWAAEKTLLDPRVRAIIKRFNPEASEQLVETWLKEGKKLLTIAKKNHSKFLKNGVITGDLLRSCLHLAKLDVLHRRGIIVRFDDINAGDIKDLNSLISNIRMEQFHIENVCLLSPTFSNATKISGIDGEADLVLDDTLIDIKTYTSPKFERRFFDQLMGYYLLSKIGGIDGAPENHEIHKVGIYFSRHEYLHVINVKDVFNQSDLSSILDWFITKGNEISGLKVSWS